MKILDLSAGNRAIWIQKNLENVTFLDKRKETFPDFVCDTTAIPDEVGEGFDLLVFDPPHLNAGKNSNTSKTYGHHTTEDILRTIKGTASEAYRVSSINALMALKWNDHDISLDRVLELLSPYWNPLFGHHLRNRGGSAAKSQSFWVMLIRRNIIQPALDMKEIGRQNKRARTTHKNNNQERNLGNTNSLYS